LPAGAGVHSLHSYFLRPGDPHEELRYTVERIRDGRSFSTRRVIACQRRGDDDVAVFALTADFHAGEPPSSATPGPCRRCPAPTGCARWPSTPPATVRSPRRRWRSAGRWSSGRWPTPFAPEPKAPPHTQSHAWFRVAGRLPEDAGVHAAALTFVTDLTLLSAGLARVGGGWGGRYVGASLDHAIWFHAPVRADEWFLYETDSPAASEGRALCFGSIWTADGRHVATVAQEGLIRSLGE
jgi:acyl-CoA thioesterase-2